MSIEILNLQEAENYMTPEHHQEVKNVAFETNYAVLTEFLHNPQASLDEIVAANPDAAQECFDANELEFCCIDGRLSEGNIGVAGSACLHEHPEQYIAHAKQVAEQQGKQIVGISSHEDCGAAKLAEVDAQEFSQHLAQQTELAYTRHLPVSPEFHDEVVIYYSGNNSLGLQQLPGMPKGFRVSRKYFPSAELALREANVATQIAFGDHGLAERFTAEKPLVIIALGDEQDPQFSAAALAQELAPLTSDRIKIIQVNYRPAAADAEIPMAAD